MAVNNTVKEKFFAKSIPISVKDVYSNQTRTRHLFLTMEWQESSPTIYSRKVLVLSLTDNDDPFFLYNLHLSEEDFQMLKASQDLLINFVSFPQHITDYLESCLQEEKSPQPRFVLVFTISDKLGSGAPPSQLDIIETNQFKNLTHLSLKFMAATETAVRQYLTTLFRSLKEENGLLTSKLSFLERDVMDKLATFQSRLSGKEQELELLKKETSVQLSEKDTQHALSLREERERLVARHKEEENRLEEEKKERERNFRKQIQQLESRVNCLDTLNKELENKNFQQDSTIRAQSSRILTLENESKRLKEGVQGVERKCEKLKSELGDRDSTLRHLEGQLHDAEMELKSKAHTIARLEDQVELNERQVKKLRDEMENLGQQLELHERHQKIHKEEKDNLEKIIMKLQDKVEEVKGKCERYARYKTIAEEKEELLLDRRKELAELNLKLEARNSEVQALKIEIDSFHQKINSFKKDLGTKENVIKFLNGELTKHCIIPQVGPPQGLEVSPSSVAQKELAKIGSVTHRKSVGSENSPSNNPSQKLVRTDRSTPSTVRRNSSTPARFHTTDSAYGASPSAFTRSDNLPYAHDCRLEDEENDEMDPEALSAAFGDRNRIVKHSTAKKPARTLTQKPTKKR